MKEKGGLSSSGNNEALLCFFHPFAETVKSLSQSSAAFISWASEKVALVPPDISGFDVDPVTRRLSRAVPISMGNAAAAVARHRKSRRGIKRGFGVRISCIDLVIDSKNVLQISGVHLKAS